MRRGHNHAYYFQGYIFPRKSNEQHYTGEFGGNSVEYIINQKPGGWNWGFISPTLKGISQGTSSRRCEWKSPLQIWYDFKITDKGLVPKVNSIMVIRGVPDHVAIVTSLKGDQVYVRHSNWADLRSRGLVSEGYFRLSDDGQKVTYNDGSFEYDLVGFVYSPFGAKK